MSPGGWFPGEKHTENYLLYHKVLLNLNEKAASMARGRLFDGPCPRMENRFGLCCSFRFGWGRQGGQRP